jgi:hypothetical protein
MYHHIYAKEEPVLSKTTSNDDLKPNKIEDDGSYVLDESATDDNEEKLTAAMGIFYALIFCIIFWVWFANFMLWRF